MKTSLLLLLIGTAAANFEEEGANRRHSLVNKVHRRLQENAAPAPVDESMSIKLTRTPTSGSASKRVVPPQNKPSSSPASAAAKTDEVATGEVTGSERAGKREEVMADGDPTFSPTYFPSFNPTITPQPTTASPTFLPSYYPTLGSGKARKVNLDDYDDDAIAKSGKEAKGGSGGGKTGKAAIEPVIDYCEQSFEKAWEANVEAKKVIAETRQELKEQCAFDTTNTKKSPFAPNLACPFIYTPDTGFLDEKEEVVEYFENITGSNETGIAFWQFQMYCECVSGLNEECAVKVPDVPPIDETGLEYCTFAGIWNGDIALDLFDKLDDEIQECGCTFVGTEKEDVAECPGLDLGGNFVDPTDV